MPEDNAKTTIYVLAKRLLVVGLGFFQLIGAVVWLILIYSMILLLFRHAFGVELPNPLNWMR